MISIISITKSTTWGQNGRHAIKLQVCEGATNTSLSSRIYNGDKFVISADLESFCGGVIKTDATNQPDYDATLNAVCEAYKNFSDPTGFCLKLTISELTNGKADTMAIKRTDGTLMTPSAIKRVVGFGATVEEAKESALLSEGQRVIGRTKGGKYVLYLNGVQIDPNTL